MGTTVDRETNVEQRETIIDPRGANHSIHDPTWVDVPELHEDTREDVYETVLETISGLFENGAVKRKEVITTLACQYVRYRRAGCGETACLDQAIERTSYKYAFGKSAVYEHIDSLPVDLHDGFTDRLEEVYTQYYQGLPKGIREHKQEITRLIRVLDSIAEVETAPEINPSDLTLREVYLDRPSERSRVLTSDSTVIGLPDPDEEDWSASILKTDIDSTNIAREKILSSESIHFPDHAIIKPRDIATYSNKYSQVLRRIFTAIQSDMVLHGKQKPGPTVVSGGKDNAAVRAKTANPDPQSSPGDYFARLRVTYRVDGSSKISVRTNGAETNYEKGPELSTPIEKLSKPGIRVLIGKRMDLIDRA
jgi:hypothetical protein